MPINPYTYQAGELASRFGYNPKPAVEQDKFSNLERIIERGGDVIETALERLNRLRYGPQPANVEFASDPSRIAANDPLAPIRSNRGLQTALLVAGVVLGAIVLTRGMR